MNPTPLTKNELKEASNDPDLSLYQLTPKNPEALTRLGIQPNSGIVGKAAEGGIIVYYEGNMYGAQNLRTLLQRQHCAAGRLTQNYPTVARTFIKIDDAIEHFDIIPWRQPTQEELWAEEDKARQLAV